MGTILEKSRELWRSWSFEQRVAAVILPLAVLFLIGLGIRELVSRPADISNPDVTFSKQEKPKTPVVRTAEDWPRYGLTRARTKYMNAPKIKPPFVRRWNYDRGELIEFAPIIVDRTLYGIDNDAVFFALNANTGKERWRRDLGSLNASSPAYSQGRLYAVNLSPPQALALRARDGKVIWRKPLPSRSESSPLYHDGRIYFGTEGGEFYAMRARDGKTIWRTNLAGSVKAAPAYVGGSLYVGDYAGDMYAIRASDGRIRWRAGSLGGSFGRGGRFYSTPAVAFGRVYAGNVDGRVYSFDRRSGRVAWTHSAGHFVYSGIAAADTRRTGPTVYFGSHDRYAYALDAQSGDVRWRSRPGGQVSGPATVIGKIAYVSTFTGNATIGFDIRTGKRRVKFGIGEYGPVVSDGVRLYVVGGGEIRAYDPVKNLPDSLKRKKSSLGVLATKAYRAAARKGKGGKPRVPAKRPKSSKRSKSGKSKSSRRSKAKKSEASKRSKAKREAKRKAKLKAKRKAKRKKRSRR